jgi:hypothetical protein
MGSRETSFLPQQRRNFMGQVMQGSGAPDLRAEVLAALDAEHLALEEVRELEAERSSFGHRITAAARSGDGAALNELAMRDEGMLTTLIAGAQIRASGARILARRLEKQALELELQDAREEAAKLFAHFQAVKSRWEDAAGRSQSIHADVRAFNIEIGQLERDTDQLVADQTDRSRGPVVRARFLS